MNIDFSGIQTPAYVVDETLLIKNLETLKRVSDATGCKILLAQKGFSMYSTYPLISKYLSGTTASTLYEAKLGAEEMEGEVHIFTPAYKESEIEELIELCDHMIFNSFSQWTKYRDKIRVANENIKENIKEDTKDDGFKRTAKIISCGIRINPEYAEVETDLYNPCAANSRLGVTLDNFKSDELDGIDGLHFHTMCEQNSDVLERTLVAVEEKFGKYLHQMKWLNFGGGHHITRADYDIEKLISCINYMKEKYDLQIYLEPGEAIALNTGYLVTSVLDISKNGMDLGILDTSAACHMPDVLEMPYRPNIVNASLPYEKEYTYRFGGPTCLAGDVIGDYSFDKPLEIGDKLVFMDMAHYTMVKNNTFNGVALPSIMLYKSNGVLEIIKEFTYEDFKGRLS